MPESRHADEMRHAAETTLWTSHGEPNTEVSADAHAITCAILYLGDVLQGIGWLYDQKIRAEASSSSAARNEQNRVPDMPLHTAVYAEDERLRKLAQAARTTRMPPMSVHTTDDGLGVVVQDLRPETVVDLLALVEVRVTRDEVSGWTVGMRRHAADYAAALHLHASDNTDVIVPSRPAFLPRGGVTRDA